MLATQPLHIAGPQQMEADFPREVFLAFKVTPSFSKLFYWFPRPALFSVRGGFLGCEDQEMKLGQAIVVAFQHALTSEK